MIRVVGAGLAGSEAAWQIACAGVPVKLYEMRPQKMTMVHKSGNCAELVCSNSLRGVALHNAVGLLKEELRLLGSLIMQAADATQVPAGGALAVDRDAFSDFISEKIRHHPLISYEVTEIMGVPSASAGEPVVIASGPLTSKVLANSIRAFAGEKMLSFYDAISPIISHDSIDYSVIFRQSRYNKGGDDYLNIPLSRQQYYDFIDELKRAQRVVLHDGEEIGSLEEFECPDILDIRPFEGCMPIEDMVDRGDDTLAFGPMKPVGLCDPRTNGCPYAVVQLRQDDFKGTLWSMVGFQTKLTYGEQVRVFRSLPGLEKAEFVRLGSVHRNTFLNSPLCLNNTFEFRNMPGLFFGGQITGVEGYVESTASGLLAGINAMRLFKGMELISFSSDTCIGALANYVSDAQRKDFQPMNASYGLINPYSCDDVSDGSSAVNSESATRCKRKLGKKERRLLQASKALLQVRQTVESLVVQK